MRLSKYAPQDDDANQTKLVELQVFFSGGRRVGHLSDMNAVQVAIALGHGPDRRIKRQSESYPRVEATATGIGIQRTILRNITDAFKDCLCYNTHLTGVELDGLQLTPDCLQLLCCGVEKSRSLRYLSVRRCMIGDDGCQMVCAILRNHRTINWIDFSACNLTERGAFLVSRMLQFQNLNRYNENWKQSLRYRTPNSEAMPGLRRITLNHNGIGDLGAQHFLQVLQDDRWIKAVDMQGCGITDCLAEIILKMMDVNDTISVLDLRNNKELAPSTVDEVILLLTKRPSEFDWLVDEPVCLPRMFFQLGETRSGYRAPTPAPNVERGKSLTSVRKAASSAFLPRNTVCNKNSRTCSSTFDLKRRSISRIMDKRSGTAISRFPSSDAGTKTIFRGRFEKSESEVEVLQRHLERLTCQLNEEIAKRKAAEATRDKAQSRLESHLRGLAETQAAITGRVLVDRGVIQEVNTAFSDLNNFFSVLQKAGLLQFMHLQQDPSKNASWNSSLSSGAKGYDDEPTSSVLFTDTSSGNDQKETNSTETQVKDEENVPNEILAEEKLLDSVKSDGQKTDESVSVNQSRVEDEEGNVSSERRPTPTAHHSFNRMNTREEDYSDESDPSWMTIGSMSPRQTNDVVLCA